MAQLVAFFLNGGFSNYKIKYDRKKKLGTGNAVVYRGSYKGRPVAVKRIVVDTLSKEDREVKTQRKLNHDNVLKILAVEEDADFRCIALELCAGTLGDVCNNKYHGPVLPPDITVLIEITTGLQFIHSQQLVHRDIKPENILISLDGRVKLADFGFCKETSKNHTYIVSGPNKGTKFWMAQELLNVPCDSPTPISSSVKSDIFSTGCVFFYFVTRGIHPFGEGNLIVGNIVNDTPVNFYELTKGDFSLDVMYMICRMLRHRPNERIALEKVLEQLKCLEPLQLGYVATTNRQTNNQANNSNSTAFSHLLDIIIGIGISGLIGSCIRFIPAFIKLFRQH